PGRQLPGARHLHEAPLDLELQRHLEEPRRARIARVEAMAEPGNGLAALQAALDDCRRRVAVRRAFAPQLPAGVEELHAALYVAAVMPPEAEHTRRHARPERRAG